MATHLLSAFAFSRRRGVRLYTVVLAIVCCHSFSAQAQPVRFQTVSIDAGKPITDNYLEVKENNLPITNVLCLYQSGDGTIWMATHSDGLISYRGNYLKHYRHEPGNPGSLPNNAVTEVWEESPTVLWLSTCSGLVKYNRLVDSFSLFSTKGRYVRKGPDGRLYTTVPELGLHIIDTIQQRIVRLPGQRIFGEDGKPVGMETMAYIKKFAFDNDGVIWATAKSKTTEGLYHLDSKNNRWIFHPPPTMYMPDAEKKGGLTQVSQPNLGIETLYIDRDNRIWCGGWADVGLLCYEKTSNQWQQFYFRAKPHFLHYNAVFQILPLNRNEFWIGTYLNGFVFNHQQRSVRQYTWLQGKEKEVSFSQEGINLMPDHCGNRWIYTAKGVFKYNPQQTGFRIQQQLPVNGDKLKAIYPIAPGRYLLSTIAGPGYDKIQSLVTEVKNGTARRLPFSIPWAVYEFIPAGKNTFYAMGARIHRIDLQKGTATRLPIQTNEPTGWAQYMEFYKTIRWNDSILYTCPRTIAEGLIKVNLRRNEAVHFKNASGTRSPKTPQDNGINRIMRDRHNRIWCATANGIDIFYPDTETFEHYTSGGTGDSLRTHLGRLCEVPDGTIYLASEAGVYRADATPGKKASFTFITHVGVCDWVLADRKGKLWTGTPQGVYRIDPATKTQKLFSAKEGWSWNPLSQPFRMPDGRFVMQDGAVIDPTDLPINKFKAIPRLTEFLVAGQSVKPDTAIAFKRHIRLKNNENFLSLRFTCNNYINEESNTYRYRLQGVDKDWVEAGTRTEAFYTALTPGTYFFLCRQSTTMVLPVNPNFC